MLYIKLKHKTREIQELTKLGLINPSWIRNMEIFEKFHFYINNHNNKQESYFLCGEDFKISWQSVRKVVTDLSK
ncbi:hypothetical protein EV143_11814 [Flavobacterium chryseum]|nr:hypothetical protein EV143_11814 [Flavobacterium sp. P3160]